MTSICTAAVRTNIVQLQTTEITKMGVAPKTRRMRISLPFSSIYNYILL